MHAYISLRYIAINRHSHKWKEMTNNSISSKKLNLKKALVGCWVIGASGQVLSFGVPPDSPVFARE